MSILRENTRPEAFFVASAIENSPVTKHLRACGIHCDTQCSIGGVDEESINHVLFECPPSIKMCSIGGVVRLCFANCLATLS